MIFGTAVASSPRFFPRDERGLALGVNVAAVYLGLSLGPPLGGLLTQQLGWRSVFWPTWSWARGGRARRVGTAGRVEGVAGRSRSTPQGAVLYGVGLCVLMYGLGRLPAPSGAVLVVLGLVLLAAFVALGAPRRAPAARHGAASRENRVFAFSNLAALINYAATFAVGFLLSLYLQSVRGLSAQATGALLAAQPLVQAALSPLRRPPLRPRGPEAGRLRRAWALIAVGLALLAFVGPATPAGFVVACLVLLGAGFGLFSSPNTNAVMARSSGGPTGSRPRRSRRCASSGRC